MSARRDAVELAQIQLSAEFGALVPDGVWGNATERAFTGASAALRELVLESALKSGFDITALRGREVRQPASLSTKAKPVSGYPATAPVVASATQSRNESSVLSRFGNASDLAVAAAKAGIKGSSLVNLLATVSVESGFRSVSENHRYSLASARKTFSSMRTIDQATLSLLVSKGPKAFFDVAYAPNSKNGKAIGNVRTGDGGMYYGRGLIQITGRDNYGAFARASGINVLSRPELMNVHDVAIQAAIWYWKTKVMSQGADTNIDSATKVVNKYTDSYPARRVAAAKYSEALTRTV